jgi:cytochrome b involved in lipid metabolism
MSTILKLLISQSPIVLGVVVGIVGTIIYYLFLRNKGDDDEEEERQISEQQDAEKQQQEKAARIISRKEVAQHNEIDDLWIIVDDKVYDVTKFVDKHPGGEVIARNAGSDATRGFFGIQHPERAFVELEDYLIGRVPDNEKTRFFDLKELEEKYNTEDELYIIINGRVHDVTKFLNEHPGGRDNLLRFASGKDATTAFFGSQHPKDVKKRLGEFFVGYLKKEGEGDFIKNNVKRKAVEALKKLK